MRKEAVGGRESMGSGQRVQEVGWESGGKVFPLGSCVVSCRSVELHLFSSKSS